MTEEIDYSDPNERMSSPDLMTSALSNLELIRDTHWSEKDRIGVPLDDDDPDDPGGADRLAAAKCAIAAIEILIARDNARHLNENQEREILDKVCTVNSISQLLHMLAIEGGEEYPQGTLRSVFALFQELTLDVMTLISEGECSKPDGGVS